MEPKVGFASIVQNGTLPLQLDVLVVGAGICGLATAIACKEKGFDVTLLELSTEFSHVGAGLMISSNATRILCNMGLRGPLDACGTHIKKVRFLRHDDDKLLDERTYYDAEAQLEAPLWQIHRADLHDCLLAKAKEVHVKIIMGAKVQKYCWDAPSAVLEDGTVLKADVILASDGYRSRARGEMLGEYQEPRFSGYSAFRALIPRKFFEGDDELLAMLDPVEQTSYCWVGAGCHVLGYGIREGEFFNFVSTQPAIHAKDQNFVVKTDEAEVVDFYKDWSPLLVKIIKKLQPGSVLDASHAMLPSAAQGAGMGIEDGCAIAELLARAEDKSQIPAILKTFESLRRPRCIEIVETGRQNAKKWHEKDAKGGTVTDSMWEYDIKDAARKIEIKPL